MKKSALLGMMKPGEYSVCEFYSNGYHAYVEPRWCDAQSAVELSKLLIDRNDIHVTKVIITDGGDNTVFIWERGKGITFPTAADRKQALERERSSRP